VEDASIRTVTCTVTNDGNAADLGDTSSVEYYWMDGEDSVESITPTQVSATEARLVFLVKPSSEGVLFKGLIYVNELDAVLFEFTCK